MTERYLILKREPNLAANLPIWEELGEVTAAWAEKAAQNVADAYGEGEYLLAPIDGAWAVVRWTVTARTEYDVAKTETEPEPTVADESVPF